MFALKELAGSEIECNSFASVRGDSVLQSRKGHIYYLLGVLSQCVLGGSQEVREAIMGILQDL